MCNEKPAQLSRPVSLLLLLAYPFAVHVGVLTGVMWPALAILALLFLLPPLLQSPTLRVVRWLPLIILVVTGLLWLAPPSIDRVIYAPPLLITGLLLGLFARSLFPGNEPLVSRIARLMHEAPSAKLLRYTRGVTVGWVVFLTLMLLEVIGLGLFAPQEQWSLFTNFYNYLFMAGFFLLEFSLRRFFIDRAERLSLRQFLHRLITIDYRKLFWQQ